jgi:HlyD family secretion protein
MTGRRCAACGALAVLALACAEESTRGRMGGDVVRTAVVTRGDVTERVLLGGELRSASSVDLRVPQTEVWQLPIRWLAEDGARVAAGDRVVEFDNSSFITTLESKRLAPREAAAAFALHEDVSALDLTQKEHELRVQQLVQAKAKVLASVPADLLAARTAQERQLELRRAEVAVARAGQELAAARASAALERKVKQLELDKTRRAIESTEEALRELVLTAPRDGLIVIGDHPWMGRRFSAGETVQPGWTIVSMPDLGGGMEVHADLSDVDDGRVGVDDQATCTLDAYPNDPVPCTVTDIRPVATPKGHESLRRTFVVKLAFAQADPDRMRPGMSVKVELVRTRARAVLVVPRGALHGDDGAYRVALAKGGTREVGVGPCDAQACAIEQGLAEGETVVIGRAP